MRTVNSKISYRVVKILQLTMEKRSSKLEDLKYILEEHIATYIHVKDLSGEYSQLYIAFEVNCNNHRGHKTGLCGTHSKSQRT